MAMIYAFGHISGAHFNPAVTLAFALTPPLPCPRSRRLLAAQLVGRARRRAASCAPVRQRRAPWRHPPVGSDAQSFLREIILTSFLMFVIMAVATDTRAVGQAAAIAIGGTIGLDALFGGPITGASMNPARSMGPAFVSGDLDSLWIYIAAPLAGATLGASPTS